MAKIHPLGQKIKAFRLKRQWTQAQVARHLGISRRTVQALESGQSREIRALTAAKINMAIEAIEGNEPAPRQALEVVGARP
jgi:transcriptional regulator with XRE-family HTH domain